MSLSRTTQNIKPDFNVTPSEDAMKLQGLPLPTLDVYTARDIAITIVRAGPERSWMNATGGNANRCLPLRMANQFGWFILNDRPVRISWNGGEQRSDLTVYAGSVNESANGLEVVSHFGHGILTWKIPVLFRTSPDLDLIVRGPTNLFKDGAVPLDGVVETDWTISTFTMNWKVTRPNTYIEFDVDEPICMLLPYPRGLLNSVVPSYRVLGDDARLHAQLSTWLDKRDLLIERKLADESSPSEWQKDYFAGRDPEGKKIQNHLATLSLLDFEWNREQGPRSVDRR